MVAKERIEYLWPLLIFSLTRATVELQVEVDRQKMNLQLISYLKSTSIIIRDATNKYCD